LLRRRRSTSPSGSNRRRRIRKLRLSALLLILFLLGVTAFTFGLITAVAGQIPNCDPTRVPREVDGHIYANDGHTILATLRGSESRILVDNAHIAPIMQQAIVAVEDKRFYEHRGIDLRGIGRAVWADITSKKVVQGGSTITQQFVKNSCVTTARTISRKLKEAALAWQLEQRWKKPRILTAYLNTIYFGNGAYGIQRAAQTYFNTSASRLTLPQAALLAGIPADPSRFDPVTNPKTARARRLEVLKAMLAQDEISAADLKRANVAALPRAADVRLPGIEGPAPFFVNYVKQQLIERYGTRRVFGGGLDVQSTIDLRLQKLARHAIETVLKEPNGPSAALVAIRPTTGEVLAMYGGDNFRQSQFNLAVQGERQAGSSFKPFVLATALRQGVSPSTTFPSRPVSIFIGDRYWVVHNYENAYMGSADLATATIESDNSIFAQLTRLVGPANVARTAHLMGITRRLNPYFAIGLGADPVSPLEMARAFSTFANEGRRVDGSTFGNRPRAIARVANAQGQMVDDNRPIARTVLTHDEDALLTSILEGVVRSGRFRLPATTSSPDCLSSGRDSPVSSDSSACVVPSITAPSAANASPTGTRTWSPRCRRFASTISIAPCASRRITDWGRRSPAALSRQRSGARSCSRLSRGRRPNRSPPTPISTRRRNGSSGETARYSWTTATAGTPSSSPTSRGMGPRIRRLASRTKSTSLMSSG